MFGNSWQFTAPEYFILIGLHDIVNMEGISKKGAAEMTERVSYHCDAGIAYISMDDGKVNAMSTQMLRDLDAALDRAQSDKAIVVLRSARKGIFSAGFDLKVFAANDPVRSLEMAKAGAELALRLMAFPNPTVGVMEGHAFPMGTFLLLACDVRLGALGKQRMGLNEVVIGITPPRFAIELARSRLHPAWLSRTVTLGEMYEPEDAVTAGFLDRAVPATQIDATLGEILSALKGVNVSMHSIAKLNLRGQAMAAMREAIDTDLTLDAYRAAADRLAGVVLPERNPGVGLSIHKPQA
jgi:enoyl-CoA hydratase